MYDVAYVLSDAQPRGHRPAVQPRRARRRSAGATRRAPASRSTTRRCDYYQLLYAMRSAAFWMSASGLFAERSQRRPAPGPHGVVDPGRARPGRAGARLLMTPPLVRARRRRPAHRRDERSLVGDGDGVVLVPRPRSPARRLAVHDGPARTSAPSPAGRGCGTTPRGCRGTCSTAPTTRRCSCPPTPTCATPSCRPASRSASSSRRTSYDLGYDDGDRLQLRAALRPA